MRRHSAGQSCWATSKCRLELVDKTPEAVQLCAARHRGDNCFHHGGEVGGHGTVPGHVEKLRHQRVRAAREGLEDRNLGEAVELLDWFGNGGDQLQFRWGRIDLVHLHDAVGKEQVGVASPHA